MVLNVDLKSRSLLDRSRGLEMKLIAAVYFRVHLRSTYSMHKHLLPQVYQRPHSFVPECAFKVPDEPATMNGHTSRKTDPSRLAPEDAFYAKRLKDATRNSSRRRKGTWRKLLWVRQSCKLGFPPSISTSAANTYSATQIQTTTQTKTPSLTTSREILDCNPTNFGV